MKATLQTFVFLALVLGCISCSTSNSSKEESEEKGLDLSRLLVLKLDDQQYGQSDYTLLQRPNEAENSIDVLLMDGDDVASSFTIPRVKEGSRELSITKMEKTDKGFSIMLDSGRANYLNRRNLTFKHTDGKFFLTSIANSHFNLTTAAEKHENITVSPPIPMDIPELLGSLYEC